MIRFFNKNSTVFAVRSSTEMANDDLTKLIWLFDDAYLVDGQDLSGNFVGPRASMVTPWSTNAVEIVENMGIQNIDRIEVFESLSDDIQFDPMLFQKYDGLDQNIFSSQITPEPTLNIDDINLYNIQEGLSLSVDEVEYLENLSLKLQRKLTDSEVFGFSQVNSEHCRHKIFNGTFIIDGVEKPHSLFAMIKNTSKINPNTIISAYKDNVAFVSGPDVLQFAPEVGDKPSYYNKKPFASVLSLKAETHNFPTTVEPFNGAATGSGGEIRDRLAGGQGSIPLAGTAVYMTAYPRLADDKEWEKSVPQRPWLYQTPKDILIKASNGASDFGNKFGQPLIAGSLFTFEHIDDSKIYGYDKVIMLAGGIGYGKLSQAQKQTPQLGDEVVILGGDNYRIGMGGAAVSSADTGALGTGIELNAIQRSNPEMQKRVANAIRALVECDNNPIVSIHDHGAGGHLNCLSELVEATGGIIDIDALPIGDPTLSAKELIGNESQERMGLVISPKDIDFVQAIADREKAPFYKVGTITSDHRFVFFSPKTGQKPIDLAIDDMFGSSPKMIISDNTVSKQYPDIVYDQLLVEKYLHQVLQLEAVACKDWLTNKVDRCVGGRVAKQQCTGPLQLPLNNCGVMALDFDGHQGIATSIGHSPVSTLINPSASSRNSIGEALTNIVWAPLKDGLKSVSLSANWMWASKNQGEDAKLYQAVESCSQFAIDLGINIPTGKDSLSMKQKYIDRDVVAPGTVIISAAAHCDDIRLVIEPTLKNNGGKIYYLNLSGMSLQLGGSSLAQVVSQIGNAVPDITDPFLFHQGFEAIQHLVKNRMIVAGHDIGNGGLITTLLEMTFADDQAGASVDLTSLGESDIIKLFFSENVGVVFQAKGGLESEIEQLFENLNLKCHAIGHYQAGGNFTLVNGTNSFEFDIVTLRDIWYKTSYLLDRFQSGSQKALERFNHYKVQPLKYKFPNHFTGDLPKSANQTRIKAAVIREKGSNSERELAHAMYLAGFDVKDVHMTDLISGRETLEDIQFIGAVGGFSNSDVLGSAKGWAGSFKYNEKAKQSLSKFFERTDTLSVGICNGCQLFIELGLIYPEHNAKPSMKHNDSLKHESAFTSVTIEDNKSIMMSSLAGSTLGVWISHGEGRFSLPESESEYHIVGKYGYSEYPANPNGSDYNTAMMSSHDGRHLVMMPHIERSIFQWNWAYYLDDRQDAASPWLEAFTNARKWLEKL